MTTKTQKITSIILLVFFAVSIFFTAFPVVFAEETDLSEIYTDVMEDLEKDPEFDKSKYPYDEAKKDYEVITIAESDAGELFLYLHQGFATDTNYLPAIEVRISKSKDEKNPTPKDYSLTLISRNEGFMKYKVYGFNVESDRERYYQIVQIVRKDNSSSSSDVVPMAMNIIPAFKTAVCPINQNWKAYTEDDGSVKYGYTWLETMVVDDLFAGSILYRDGYHLFGSTEYTESHFVVFNADRDMDHIIDADISFCTQTYFDNVFDFDPYLSLYGFDVDHLFRGSSVPFSLTLKDTDTVSNEPFGPFDNKYTWNRIQSVSIFLSETSDFLSPKAVETISSRSWVFRFLETDYKEYKDYTFHTIEGTAVSDITILRLHFKYGKESYNLNVVSNKVTPDLIPEGSTDSKLPTFPDISSGCNDINELLSSILLIVGLGLIALFCPWVFTILWAGLKLIFWIIFLPFKLLIGLFDKKDKKR